jgi:hypothetical protein
MKGNSMLKMLLFFVFFATSTTSYSQDFVQGDGRFDAAEDDSLSFINTQLIHQGIVDVLTKELVAMNLNKDLFWQKYEEKFLESFQNVEASLKQKYKIGTSEENSKLKEAFAKELRGKRLTAKAKYGSLNRVIQSYVIKKQSRSQQDPNTRFIKLEASVNRNMLSQIYYRYVRGNKSSDYGSLYLNIQYKLPTTTYKDLGVEKARDFTDTVNEHWLKWFSENKPTNIANVEILTEQKLARLQDYFKLPYERMLQDIPEAFVNSLYLEIVIEIEKLGENEKFKEYEFAFSGGGYLLDLQTNKIMSTLEMPKEVKKYRNLEYNKLSTVLANHVYRMPVVNFSNISKTIKDVTPIKSIQRLSLFDFSNMGELDKFTELLLSRGIKYSLHAKLDSLGLNRADLIIFMDGEIPELKSLLQEIKGEKSGSLFDLIDTDNNLGVKFIKVQEESKPVSNT